MDGERLRLSNAESERLLALEGWWRIAYSLDARAARALLYHLGALAFVDRLLVAWTRSEAGAADAAWHEFATLPLRWPAPVFPLKAADFMNLGLAAGPPLGAALRAAEAAWIAADFPAMNDIYVIVNDVEGLASGAYFFDARRSVLVTLGHGDFRDRATYLALEQDLAGDAAASVFFLADLEPCLETMGNRGYRAVQFEAGILGGRMYLGAYAQRLGATGLTFFDDEVTEFFSPHSAGKEAIFLVAVGHPARPA